MLETWKRGFDRLAPDTMGVPSYTEGIRTFALAVKSGEDYFTFMAGGKWFMKTATESIVWPDVSGSYYFYFDMDGVLQYILDSGLTESIFVQSAICGLVYWNAIEGEIIVEATDEQHGYAYSSYEHLTTHMSLGARYAEAMKGGVIEGLSGGSDTYTGMTAFGAFDEDIFHYMIASTTHKWMYREGVDGIWKKSATANNKVGHDGGGNTYYNKDTAGTWSLEPGGSATDFVINYMMWHNDKRDPTIKIVGQQAYGSRGDARDALDNELGKLKTGGYPSTEAFLMFAWVTKRNGDLEDDGSGNTYFDLRGRYTFANS